MSDDMEFDMDDLADEVEADVEPEEAVVEKKEARKKDDLPEGYLTPTGLAHLLTERFPEFSPENPFRPQMVYGYVKNGKDFPSQEHTDGRVIVPVEAAVAWIEERREKRIAREAAKAEAEANADGEEE